MFKKFLQFCFIFFGIGAAVAPAIAAATGTILTLPDNFVSSTLAYTGYLFSDLSVYIYMIVGISLGLIVLEVVVNLHRKDH
jgi:hypothetical protein